MCISQYGPNFAQLTSLFCAQLCYFDSSLYPKVSMKKTRYSDMSTDTWTVWSTENLKHNSENSHRGRFIPNLSNIVAFKNPIWLCYSKMFIHQQQINKKGREKKNRIAQALKHNNYYYKCKILNYLPRTKVINRFLSLNEVGPSFTFTTKISNN